MVIVNNFYKLRKQADACTTVLSQTGKGIGDIMLGETNRAVIPLRSGISVIPGLNLSNVLQSTPTQNMSTLSVSMKTKSQSSPKARKRVEKMKGGMLKQKKTTHRKKPKSTSTTTIKKKTIKRKATKSKASVKKKTLKKKRTLSPVEYPFFTK